MNDYTTLEPGVDGAIAQYRALVVLASRGPRRLVDLAAALDVAPSTQDAVARALRAFADAAGEVPDGQWPAAVPGTAEAPPRPRPPVQPGKSARPVSSARAGSRERA